MIFARPVSPSAPKVPPAPRRTVAVLVGCLVGLWALSPAGSSTALAADQTFGIALEIREPVAVQVTGSTGELRVAEGSAERGEVTAAAAGAVVAYSAPAEGTVTVLVTTGGAGPAPADGETGGFRTVTILVQ